MMEENYVSFEVAKLLKEKGFDGTCRAVYVNEQLVHCTRLNIFDFTNNERIKLVGDENTSILAPTLQMAIKWLEEVHHILVVPDYIYEFTDTSWCYKIYRLGENGKPERCVVKGVSYDDDNNPTEHIVGYRDYELSYKYYATRKEAETEGIRYVLEKYV